MQNNLTIVTAANAKFYQPLVNLLWTIARYEPMTKVVVWDLGLTAEQLTALKGQDVRTFAFAKYPAYFDMATNSGNTAFRPVILSAMAAEFGSYLLWLDSGCLVKNPLGVLRGILKKNGVCSPPNSTLCKDYLHPTAVTASGATDEILSQRIRRAGIVGFDCDHPAAKDLLSRWLAAAMNHNVIAPDGSNKVNHNQSAVFSVVLYQTTPAITLDDSNIGIDGRLYGMSLKQVQFRCGFKSVEDYRKWRDSK